MAERFDDIGLMRALLERAVSDNSASIEFVAHAKTQLPKLLDELARLRNVQFDVQQGIREAEERGCVIGLRQKYPDRDMFLNGLARTLCDEARDSDTQEY